MLAQPMTQRVAHSATSAATGAPWPQIAHQIRFIAAARRLQGRSRPTATAAASSSGSSSDTITVTFAGAASTTKLQEHLQRLQAVLNSPQGPAVATLDLQDASVHFTADTPLSISVPLPGKTLRLANGALLLEHGSQQSIAIQGASSEGGGGGTVLLHHMRVEATHTPPRNSRLTKEAREQALLNVRGEGGLLRMEGCCITATYMPYDRDHTTLLKVAGPMRAAAHGCRFGADKPNHRAYRRGVVATGRGCHVSLELCTITDFWVNAVCAIGEGASAHVLGCKLAGSWAHECVVASEHASLAATGCSLERAEAALLATSGASVEARGCLLGDSAGAGYALKVQGSGTRVALDGCTLLTRKQRMWSPQGQEWPTLEFSDCTYQDC